MKIRRGWALGAIALLITLLLPLVLSAPLLSLPTEVFIFAVFAMSYDLIFGYTGLISFGQALFVGSGGYALAVATGQHGLPLWLGLVTAAGIGLALALITGMLALRTRGVYFAMVTLAFAQAAVTFAGNDIGNLTGGTNGETVNNLPNWLVAPGNEMHLYYVTLGFLVAAFLLLRLLVSSPGGRVWQAIRENEGRARMLGYRPYPYKLAAYAVSGTVCGLAGGMYAIYIGYVSTDNLSAGITIQLLLMVIIGGAGSLWGAVAGAGVLEYANHYLNQLPGSGLLSHFPIWVQNTAGQPLLILGIIYLGLIYFFPEGIAGLLQKHAPWLSGGRAIPGIESSPGTPAASTQPPPNLAEHLEGG